MSTSGAADRRGRHLVALGGVFVLGLVLGFFGSAFGPLYAIILAAVLAVIGAVTIAADRRWGRSLLVGGIAIGVGALLYVAIGVLTPDGAGSGSGGGCAPGGSCQQK